jgi:hypothetical protein
MDTSDLSEADFNEILNDELGAIDDASWEKVYYFGTHVDRVVDRRQTGKGLLDAPVWVICRTGEHVLGYDEIEEEYGTGTLGSDGSLADWGTWGERLSWALQHFPDIPRSGEP